MTELDTNIKQLTTQMQSIRNIACTRQDVENLPNLLNQSTPITDGDTGALVSTCLQAGLYLLGVPFKTLRGLPCSTREAR